MILVILIFLPVIGGILAWIAGRWNTTLPRWIALLTMLTHLVIALAAWVTTSLSSGWMAEINMPWIPSLGISLHLGADGISLLLVILTSILGVVSVLASWTGITERVGFFHFVLLWILGTIVGVFVSLDLFLFYFFWEMTLVPLYFLIAIWGHEARIYASIKFFIFTQASSLFMLLSILGLYFINAANTGVFSFDYDILLNTTLPAGTALWLCLGFLLAFLVKLPAVPFHTWLPDAHTEAPTAGSVVLAGLVLKLGAYGLFRFVLPLFAGAAQMLSSWMMALGGIGILYGALMAFGQTDFKRLVAYTSVSHMGFVLVGVFSMNPLGLQGAMIVMLAHGISTGALFVMAGILQDRLHTRDMSRMGGLWDTVPRLGGISMLFALASLGLPGLGNFVGEFLVLLGAFHVNLTWTVLATLGFVGSTVYALYLIQRAFQGPNRNDLRLPDINPREAVIFASLIVIIVWMGLNPQPLINTAQPAIQTIQNSISRQGAAPDPAVDAQGQPGAAVKNLLAPAPKEEP